MIYAKILIPVEYEGLRRVNTLIDYMENQLGDSSVFYRTDKSMIKFKSNSVLKMKDIYMYIEAKTFNYKLIVFDEDTKTETVLQVMDGTVQGEYKLPLFPEDYKF